MNDQTERQDEDAERSCSQAGFTLIELLIVMAIIGILVTIAQPSFQKTVIRAREAVLKDDLFQMREAIDQFYADNGKYPDQLERPGEQQDAVQELSSCHSQGPLYQCARTGSRSPRRRAAKAGVFDVHSASPLVALDGTSYNSW